MDSLLESLLLRLQCIEEKIDILNNASIILTREQLCKKLNITVPTVIRWEKKGKLPFFKIGSSVRYNWPAVMKALETV